MTHDPGLSAPQGLPDGSALTYIFDHCLRYPGSYEIPLRTMFDLNMNSVRCATPTKSTFDSDEPVNAASELRSQLSHLIARYPSQPGGLPPSFITSFLRRSFAANLHEVEFSQALTALDYLRDLDARWRKEVTGALRRLGIESDSPTSQADLARNCPGVLTWIEALNAKIHKAEVLYSRVYIGLRRWTLVNEMLLSEPYNKPNCMTLLNTLFPPVSHAAPSPSPHLTPSILEAHRGSLFRYIMSVGSNGKQILDRLIVEGAREGDSNGWPVVREALDRYLRLSNEIIDECTAVTGPVIPHEAAAAAADNNNTTDPSSNQSSHNKGRKVDSGISFGINETKPNTPPSSSHGLPADSLLDKPLPPSPTGRKANSTLERLARELRKLGDSGKPKNVRKMKSVASFGSRSETGSPVPTEESSSFDFDEKKRRALFWAHSKQPSLASR